MSIQSEINRINAAKADILAALTEKGVDTTGAGLADIAALVAGIEAGGGGGAKVAIEVVTFAADTYSYTMQHNLGVVPTFAFFMNQRKLAKAYQTIMASRAIFGGYGADGAASTTTSSSKLQVNASVYTTVAKEITSALGTTGPDIGNGTKTTIDFGAIKNYMFYAGDMAMFVAGRS